MTSVIKADGGSHGISVERFLSKPAVREQCVPAGKRSLEADPLVAENERLRALLDQREVTIAGQIEAIAQAYADGEAAGRLAMESEIEDDRAASLEALEAGLIQARDALNRSFASAESLAALIAREVLDKLLGERAGDARQHLVMDLIAHQFARLGKGSIVSAEVSREDFPDTSEVARLADELGLPAGALSVSSERPSGDCVLKLRLGEIDIGLGRQWSTLRSALEEMANGDEALA